MEAPPPIKWDSQGCGHLANPGVAGEDGWERHEPSLVAAYVSDAQYNRNVPFQTSPQAIRLYYFYNHWAMRMATYFFICVNLSLALFEEPVLFLLPFLSNHVSSSQFPPSIRRTESQADANPNARVGPAKEATIPGLCLPLGEEWSSVPHLAPLSQRCFKGKFATRMPAYTLHWLFSSYFMTCIIINSHIFMSVFLAMVYNNDLQNGVQKLASLKCPQVLEAFCLLKFKVGTEVAVKEAAWKQLVKVVVPDISTSHLELLLRTSDEGQRDTSSSVKCRAQSLHQIDFTLDLSETQIWRHFSVAHKMNFLRLADLLNVQVVTVNIRRHLLEAWVPWVYQSSASLLVQRMVWQGE
ncbi:uncharacterized protein ACH125_004262 [Urocitellus parryii]